MEDILTQITRYGLIDAPFLIISVDKMRPGTPAFTETRDLFRTSLKNLLDPHQMRKPEDGQLVLLSAQGTIIHLTPSEKTVGLWSLGTDSRCPSAVKSEPSSLCRNPSDPWQDFWQRSPGPTTGVTHFRWAGCLSRHARMAHDTIAIGNCLADATSPQADREYPTGMYGPDPSGSNPDRLRWPAGICGTRTSGRFQPTAPAGLATGTEGQSPAGWEGC